MKLLEELVTDKTPTLNLKNPISVSLEEKIKILDLKSNLDYFYAMDKMVYKNSTWYYFKKEDLSEGYPFYIMDELLGTYLANLLNLKTVSYEIAYDKYKYGIASCNFKKEGFSYFTYKDLYKDYSLFENIDFFNKEQLNILNKILKLIALDIYMIQKDRSNVNFQLEMDNKTKKIDIAPIYDYSNCNSLIGMSGFEYKSVFININDLTLPKLIKNYPKLKNSLEFLLEQSMENIFDLICQDYQFNKDTYSYEKIKQHYKLKDKNQKAFLNNILTDRRK